MKSSRRLFLKQSSVTMVGCSLNAANPLPVDAPFVHHVFLWLKDKDDKANYNNMLKSLQGLRKIREVRFLHVGAPSISDLDYEARGTDASYTFSYLAFFDSKKDKENYLASPLHTKFFADFKDLVSKAIIYDSLSISK